jgi:hypothetical protein
VTKTFMPTSMHQSQPGSNAPTPSAADYLIISRTSELWIAAERTHREGHRLRPAMVTAT